MTSAEKKVTFVLGPAGSGKTRHILGEVESRCKTAGAPLQLLLVPDQATALYERELLCATESGVVAGATVTGFARLPFMLPPKGWSPPNIASQSVRRMALYKALAEGVEGGAISKAAQSVGMLDQLLDYIDEIRRSGLSAADVEAVADEGENPWLSAKLGELSYAAARLDNEMENAGLTDALGAQLEFADSLKQNAPACPFELYIDGFSSFSAIEMRIVESLLVHANCAHIAILIEPGLLENPEKPPDSIVFESVFGHTISTYLDIDKAVSRMKLARKYVRLPEVSGLDAAGRFKDSKELHCLERKLAGAPFEPPGRDEPAKSARIIELPTRAAEVRHAAREIKRLALSGARYREISLLARSLSHYRDLVVRTFERFEIPVFIDEPVSIGAHPAVRLVMAIADFAVEPSLLELMSLARNPLLGFDRADADRLENVLLRFGIHPEEVGTASVSKLVTGASPKLEALSEKLLSPIAALKDKIQPLNNAGEISTAILDFIRASGAQTKMGGYVSADDSIPLSAHREAWDRAMEAAESAAAICADSPVTVALYRDFLRSSLTGATAKITPPTLDQVTVSDVERGRQMNPKHVFILGLLEGEFPRQAAETGLLSQDDRLFLRERGVRLIGDGTIKYVAERYYFYVACTRASETLTLTIPVKESADALRSSFVSLLTDGGFLGVERLDAPETPPQIGDAVSVEEAARVLKISGVSAVAYPADLRGGKLGKLAHLLMLTPPDSFVKLLKGVNGQRLSRLKSVSATRLELLASCRFKHFAQYDLRLEERKEWKVDPLDVGTIYHRALELALIESKRRNIKWRDGDRSALKGILHECFSDALHDPEADWSKNPAIKLVEKRLWNNLEAFFACSLDALAAGDFEPESAELEFGEPEDAGKAALKVVSAAGSEYFLRGKIDRLDKSSGGNLIAVVDYKSSTRGMNWNKLYFGLGVQIALYGYAVKELFEETGAVKREAPFDPFESGNAPVLCGVFTHGIDSEIGSAKSRRGAAGGAQSKLRGIISAEYARAFDRGFTGFSKYYGFGLKQDGDLRGDSRDVLEPEDWRILFEWFGGKLISLLRHLDEGDIAVTPVRLGGATGYVSCNYCPYGAVCRVRTGRDVTRLSPPVDEGGKPGKKAVVKKMRMETEGGE